jgi:hypothetical protein
MNYFGCEYFPAGKIRFFERFGCSLRIVNRKPFFGYPTQINKTDLFEIAGEHQITTKA